LLIRLVVLIASIKNSQTSSNVNSVVSCFEHKKVTLKKVAFFVGQFVNTLKTWQKAWPQTQKKPKAVFLEFAANLFSLNPILNQWLPLLPVRHLPLF
jgi:hypothetical protein